MTGMSGGKEGCGQNVLYERRIKNKIKRKIIMGKKKRIKV